MRVNYKDLATGLIFIAIAAFFAQSAIRGLPMGTAMQMGPGYYPLLLSGLLLAISIAIIVRGFTVEATPFGNWPWRGVFLVLLAPIVFGLTISGAGLAVSIFAVSFLTAMASTRMTWFMAAWLSAALSIFCIAIFVWGLGLPIPIRGPWLGGY